MKRSFLLSIFLCGLSKAFAQSGNVGIGTSTLSTPLHAVGTISSTSAATTAGSTEVNQVPPGALELFRSTSSSASISMALKLN